MKNFFILLFCLLLTPLTISGCDFKDIDRRIFIVAIGIDGASNNPELLSVSFKAAIPGSSTEANFSGGGSSENNTQVYTIVGDSMSSIFRTLKSQTSREPDYSHMKLVIYGKNFAENHDLDKIEEFLITRKDVQDMAWISLGIPSAKAILNITPKEEKIPGNSLFLKFGLGTDSPFTIKVRSYEFYSDIITPGCTPICSIMEAENNNIIMNKTALFSKGKLSSILNKEETELLTLLRDGIRFGSLSILRKGEKIPLSISIDSGKAKINIDKSQDDNSITCTIKIKIEGSLEETDGFSGKVKTLSPEMEEALKKRVMTLLNKLKENNLDPLRLEMRYWSNTLDFMPAKTWLTDMLPKINFIVDPKIDIIHTGVLGAH